MKSSIYVEDTSVIHLLKLKNLVHLNVVDTAITPKGYGAVLSGLPHVENISWSTPADDFMSNVTKDKLSSVK